MGLYAKRGLKLAVVCGLVAGNLWAQTKPPAAAPSAVPAPAAPAKTSPDATKIAAPQPATTKPAAPTTATTGQASATQTTPDGVPAIPVAELAWSVNLDKDAPQVPLTEGPYAAQRSAVLSGDRVVAIYAVRAETSRGGRPVNTYRLVSLDAATGEVKGEKKLELHSSPYLFATGDDHVLLGNSSLTRYNPDLTESGEKFTEPGHGRIACISFDGNTVARWTERSADSDRGTELLSASTLKRTVGLIRGAEPSSIAKTALLTDDQHWSAQFPSATSFVSMIDQGRPHLLYHGDCGGRPAFLSDTKILFIGCGRATVIDNAGRILKQIPLSAPYASFAGVARDGSRFAIQTSEYPANDPAYAASKLFTIYDGVNFEPVTTIPPDAGSDALPWSAFAQDGHTFLSGSAKRLSLYRIPY